MFFKLTLIGLDLAILLAGLWCWVGGKLTHSASNQERGVTLLEAWIVFDCILIIIEFPLGWFS